MLTFAAALLACGAASAQGRVRIPDTSLSCPTCVLLSPSGAQSGFVNVTGSITTSLLSAVDTATPQAGGVLNASDSTQTNNYFTASSTGIGSLGSWGFGSTLTNRWASLANLTAATSGVPAQASPDLYFSSQAWDGALPRVVAWDLASFPRTTGASYTTDLDFTAKRSSFAATPTLRLTWDGTTHSLGLNPASQISSISQGAANTTALAIAPNVADGASSVVLDVNAQTTLATAGAHFFRLRNNGTAVLDVQKSATGTTVYGSGGASAFVRLDDTNGAYLAFNANNYITAAGLASNTLSFVAGGNNVLGINSGAVASSTAKATNLGSATSQFKYLYVAGTAAVNGDFALSAGWGTTASVAVTRGDDNHVRYVVTSAGTGQAANPTVTFTFHDGTKTNIPFCESQFQATTDATINTVHVTDAPTATTDVVTYQGTPVATKTYTLDTLCTGS